MSILDKLVSSIGRRDEVPNQELAQQIVSTVDRQAVRELVAHLDHKDKVVQNNCIKVLYEIGEQNPKLILEYLDGFVRLLDSKNKRLQWGALTALDVVTLEVPEDIYGVLTKVLDTAESGSVIARDHAVGILIKFCTVEQYADQAFSLLTEQLQRSPTNQLPMYAERAWTIVNEQNKAIFVQTLTSRLNDIEKDTKRKRVEKIIKKAI